MLLDMEMDLGDNDSEEKICKILVMPYMETKFTDLIGNKNEFFIKKMMLKLLIAIRSIHNYKIVHRDIKPDNLMIFENQLYVIDLNTAREIIT